MSTGNKRVEVAVRVRPVLRHGVSHVHQQEKFELQAVNHLGDGTVQVQEQKQDEACRSSVFSFDHMFDGESTQLEVYEDAVVDLVDAALIGINATILAYGQTGSGKTHTVLGDVKPNPLENDLLTADSGLFLRVLSDLMEYKLKRKDKLHVTVGLSCVEIYNENIRDLFGGNPNEPPPQIKAVMIEDSVYMPSLIVKEVTSLQSVFSEIQLAISRRASRSTESNAASSRSHCLFMIDVLQCPTTSDPPTVDLLNQQPTKKRSGTTTSPKPQTPTAGSPVAPGADGGFLGQTMKVPGQPDPVWASKILLADLAGSEKIRNSGVSGKGLEEATAINSSLTALGNVVHSLYEGGYVSYRNSNLTRLLKPTFSQPLSRVLLLAQCSPTQLTFEETVNTLHFANKVKAMKVQTTTGAESERLQFDVIEAEKVYDALLADLHIWMEESECRPVIHKGGFVSGGYYDAEASKRMKYSGKQRLELLTKVGAVGLAEKDRDARDARRLKEESEKDVIKANRIKAEVETAVREHDESVEELIDQIKEELKQVNAAGSQIVSLMSSSNRMELTMEEESVWIALTTDAASAQHRLMQQALQRANAEWATISKEKIEPAQVDREMENRIAAEDERYAESVWAHCGGKRFLCRLLQLREAQQAYFTAVQNRTLLQAWSSKMAAVAAEKAKSRHEDPVPS